MKIKYKAPQRKTILPIIFNIQLNCIKKLLYFGMLMTLFSIDEKRCLKL